MRAEANRRRAAGLVSERVAVELDEPHVLGARVPAELAELRGVEPRRTRRDDRRLVRSTGRLGFGSARNSRPSFAPCFPS